MAQLYLDVKSDFARWDVLKSDGVTPSNAVRVVGDTGSICYGPDAKSVRMEADAGAAALDLLRFTLPATDLSDFDELRLYGQADRLADGIGRSFFLELRLGSAALPPDANGNAWHRYLPFTDPGSWELIRLSLSDLPLPVRQALTTVQLRVLNADAPFVVRLDDLSAVREEMIADVEAALVQRLDGRFSIGGKPVAAAVHPRMAPLPDPSPGPNGASPIIRIVPYHLQPAEGSLVDRRARRDFRAGGHSISPPLQAWELTYRLDAVGSDRQTEARIADFVLRTLGSSGSLVVGSYPLPMLFAPVPPAERAEAAALDPGETRLPLLYRIFTRQEVGSAQVARPARDVRVGVDLPSAP